MLIGATANPSDTVAVLVSREGTVLRELSAGPGMDALGELVTLLESATNVSAVGVVLQDYGPSVTDLLPARLRQASAVQALTWGEARFGIGRRQRDFAVVHAGREIEAGLVLDGTILPKPSRLGHTSIDRTGERICRCGRIGCLQALVDSAMTGTIGPASALPSELLSAPTSAISYLGLGLIHLVNLINPAGLVLAGPLIEETPEARSWLASAVMAAALAPSRAGLREIVAPHAGPLSMAIGAAVFADSPASRPEESITPCPR